MFEKKYIFETKSTRFRRFIFNSFQVFLILVIGYFALCAYLPYYGLTKTDKAKNAFYKKNPDLVAVYTGDANRIDYAIELAKRGELIPLFISGVYRSNTIQILLDLYQDAPAGAEPPPLETDKKTNTVVVTEETPTVRPQLIEIDYLARNTIENVISTLNYLRTKKQFKRILIVSSDYHIQRIKLIVDRLKRSDDPFEFHYHGTKSDYKQWRTIKILLKESTKLLKELVVLLFWDDDTESQHQTTI